MVFCSVRQYDENIVNLKIESPVDDNYSDDELTFLPYYTFLGAADAAPFFDSQQLRLSYDRTWAAVRGLRSAAWISMYAGRGGKNFDASDLDNLLWCVRVKREAEVVGVGTV